MATNENKNAPMASAPMKYDEDGAVAWGHMWDSFCALPRDGGPPHRETLLEPEPTADPREASYQFATQEIIRGIREVSGLVGTPAEPGWIAVRCPSAGMAHWLAEAITEENVHARHDGPRLLVPVGTHYSLKGEIKNVITAVAKTTHYWHDHLPTDVKNTVELQARLATLGIQVRRWLGRRESAAAGNSRNGR